MSWKSVIIFISLFIIAVSMIGFGSSATYKINDAFNLTTSCKDFTCSKVATTIFYPNGTIFQNNVSMSSNVYFANLLVTPTTQGDYLVYFSDGINVTTSSFSATSTGFELTQPRAIIIVSSLFLLIFLFVVNIGGIAILPSKNERNEEGELISINTLKYLRSVLFGIGYLILLSIAFLVSNVSLAYLGTALIGNLFFVIFQVMLIMLLPMFVIWLMFILTSIFRDMEFKKMISRGVGL